MNKSVDFEVKIKKIEEILEILDSGEQPLEELMKYYEEGIKLTSECKDFLNQAEMKIIDISKKYEVET